MAWEVVGWRRQRREGQIKVEPKKRDEKGSEGFYSASL